MLGGTTRLVQKISVNSLGILGVHTIKHQGVVGTYLLGTDCVVGERRLSLTALYREGEMILLIAIILMIRGSPVHKVSKKHTNMHNDFFAQTTVLYFAKFGFLLF